MTEQEKYMWLADAPLFIDASLIERFYDAVIRPTYMEGATSIKATSTGDITLGAEVGATGKFSFGGGLLRLLTGAEGGLELNAKGKLEKKQGTSQGREIQWLPIQTPQRQLTQLVLSYSLYAQMRLCEFSPNSDSANLYNTKFATDSPRAIVILDLPGVEEASATPTSMFPMAAELADGSVVLLYEQFKESQIQKISKKLAQADLPGAKKMLEDLVPPSTVGNSPVPTGSVAVPEQKDWEKFSPLYNPWDAMKVLEDAAKGQRIRWIDFQMACSLTSKRAKLHLHICPAALFDTGAFAYNFIFRAYYYGVRIVATLKSGHDLNVLAIYEK